MQFLQNLIIKIDNNLKIQFNDYFYNRSIIFTRVALILCFLLYVVFGLLDFWMAPEVKVKIWMIRFLIVCPVVGLGFFFTFLPFFKKSMNLILILVSLVVGYGIVSMLVIITKDELGNRYYFLGLMLVMIWNYSLLRLKFRYALLSSLLILIGYNLITILFQNALVMENIPVLINNNFFFFSVNILGGSSCFTIEYYLKKDFLQNVKIQEESNNRIQELLKSSQDGLEIGNELQSSSKITSNLIDDLDGKNTHIQNNLSDMNNDFNDIKSENNNINRTLGQFTKIITKQNFVLNESINSIKEMISSINNLFNLMMTKKDMINNLNTVTHEGKQNMQELAKIINKIHESSSSINDIIQIIDDISIQIDLLSINAMTEAAHAGNYGSGFKVVAHNIRGFSNKTKDSIKLITNIITKSNLEIEHAFELNKKSNQYYDEIHNEIINVVNEINNTITKLDKLAGDTTNILNEIEELSQVKDDVDASLQNMELTIKNNNKFIESLNELFAISKETLDSYNISFREILIESKKVDSIGLKMIENIQNIDHKIIDMKSKKELL